LHFDADETQNCSTRIEYQRCILESQQFLFGGRELFIAKYARIVQLGKLLELGCQIFLCRSLLDRSCVLLLLGIGGSLLVGLIVLRLRGCILLGVFFILVMVNRSGGASHNGCADRNTGHIGYWSWSSYHSPSHHHSSSHHIDLLFI